MNAKVLCFVKTKFQPVFKAPLCRISGTGTVVEKNCLLSIAGTSAIADAGTGGAVAVVIASRAHQRRAAQHRALTCER